MPDPEDNAGETEAVTEVTTEAVSESPAEVITETAEVTEQATGTTAETSTGGSEEESFFDPSSLPEELKAGWKQLQGSYTRRMQGLAANQKKVDAYNAFEANPRETIKQLAGQFGLTLQEAQAVAEQAAGGFNPETWGDVTTHVVTEVMAKLEPMMAQARGAQQSSIEHELDASIPEWRNYESQMQTQLARHPTLAEDPVALANMVIPESVRQGKAMQAALRKLDQKAKAANVTGGTQTTKEPDPLTPGKKMTFAESVAFAKKKLAHEGK